MAYECFTGVRKNTPKVNPENCAMKALSPVMIMLSTAQTMRSMNDANNDKYNAICSECLDEILHGGYLTEKALLENVTVDGMFSNTPNGRIVNPGHSMEASWFVMLEGMLTDNKEAIEAGKRIIDITLSLSWDEKHGGLISFTDVKGAQPDLFYLVPAVGLDYPHSQRFAWRGQECVRILEVHLFAYSHQ